MKNSTQPRPTTRSRRPIFRRVARATALGALGLAALLTAAVLVLERRTYDAPMPSITASADPAVIARGRYLAYGPAHCVDCHGAPERRTDALAGKPVPLSGGAEFHLPVGTFRTANVTSDAATGIGGASDGQLARALRYGVGRDGRALMPFMPFANLSDEDLTAVISFLRTQAPVRHAVATRAPNLLGHLVTAFVLEPVGPSGPVPARVAAAPTAAYGRYLVHSVGNCVGCHTVRDLRTGAFTGPLLGGGFDFVSETDARVHLVSPNLTPDPKTSRIANWSEEIFVARFHTGRGAVGSPMPWSSFGRIDDRDLQAIYRYLRTVPAVENDTGPSVRSPEMTAQAEAAAASSRSRSESN